MPKKKDVVEEGDFEVGMSEMTAAVKLPFEPYYLECILRARLYKGKKWEYLIKWGGYSEDYNSWEPESNLTNCKRILKGFWAQTGMKSKDAVRTLAIGEELIPSEEWVERQLEIYRATFEKKEHRKKKLSLSITEEEDIEGEQATELETAVKDSKEDRTIAEAAIWLLPPEYSDPDDIPLSQKVAVKINTNIREEVKDNKRKRSEGQEGDVPARKRVKLKLESLESDLGDQGGIEQGEGGPITVLDEASSGHDSLFSDFESNDEPLAQRVKKTGEEMGASEVVGPSRPAQSSKSLSPSLETRPKTPKSSTVPLHVQRRQNPRVKQMAIDELPAGQFQGISTKARVSGQSALAAEIGKTSPISSNTHKISLDASSWLTDNIAISGTVKADTPVVQPASASSSMVLPKERIKKRWRWTGQLAIGDNEAEDAYAEIIGEVELKDEFTLDPSSTSLSIQQLIPNNVESLCLRHTYPLSLVTLIMAGFKLSHFAKMYRSTTSTDNSSFQEMIMYMTGNRMCSLAPLYIRDVRAATLFVFPTCFMDLNERLKIPPRLWCGEGLLVAVGIQAYHASKGFPVDPYNDTWKTQHIITKPSIPHPSLDRAMTLLGFPVTLFERISGKECSLLPARNFSDTETLALEAILMEAGGKIIRLAGPPARFIFLHVSVWDNLHKLPALVDRRSRPYIYFFTYGSDPSVHRRFWGVREVFPIGGVVSFTPRAIAEAPEAIHGLIDKLDRHPLWACYILPSVIGVMADMIESESDDSKLKSTVEALSSILTSIDQGQLALTWHPLSFGNPDITTGSLDERLSMWADEQEHLCALSGFELVLECQKRFKASKDRTEKDLEASIVKDMTVMQSELRYEYRRFVIIADTNVPINTSKEAAANSSASRAGLKDMFEWSHFDKFIFGDDFFETPAQIDQVPPVTNLSIPTTNL